MLFNYSVITLSRSQIRFNSPKCFCFVFPTDIVCTHIKMISIFVVLFRAKDELTLETIKVKRKKAVQLRSIRIESQQKIIIISPSRALHNIITTTIIENKWGWKTDLTINIIITIFDVSMFSPWEGNT